MIRACFLRLPPAGRGLSAPQHAAAITSKRWAPGTRLRIAFRGGTVADRKAVMIAAGEWMRYANVWISEVKRSPAELRCSFDRTSGSWSMLGTDALLVPPDQATLNMGWPDDPGRDLHELGHALGLIHEHQNPSVSIPWDRDKVISYYAGAPNFWPPAQTIANVLAPVDPRGLTNGGFDRQSVMLYPIPAALLTDPKFAVGWNTKLSDGDKAFISRVYPRT